MAQFLGSPYIQYYNATTGQPYAGGKLYTYAHGTVTPIATYQSIADAQAQTNANTNPVILDSSGKALVVISGSTDLVLYDSNNVLVWSMTNGIGTAGADIVDENGNEYLTFTTTPNAVNYFNIQNAATGGQPTLLATGPDTNVAMYLKCKGSANINLYNNLAMRNSTTSQSLVLQTSNSMASSYAITYPPAAAGSARKALIDSNGTGTLGWSAVQLPSADGASGTALTTNGSGVTSFTQIIPAGVILPFGSTTIPTGYLECDGSAVSRTTYAALFAAIGTTFGAGDGSTTFNVPQCQRQVLVGRGGVAVGSLGTTIGSQYGEEKHTLTTGELPAHTHGSSAAASVGSQSVNAGGITVANNGTATGSTGSDTPHNNIQPSLVVVMMIKT